MIYWYGTMSHGSCHNVTHCFVCSNRPLFYVDNVLWQLQYCYHHTLEITTFRINLPYVMLFGYRHDFEWLKMIRYYWEEDIDNCVAKMSSAVYIYGHEYLGAGGTYSSTATSQLLD